MTCLKCDVCKRTFDPGEEGERDYYEGPKDPHDMTCSLFQDFMTVCEACLEKQMELEIK